MSPRSLGAFHIDEGCAKKLKVLRVGGGELACIDRFTSLVELNLSCMKVSEKELQNISSLPRLKILRLHSINRYVRDDGYLFSLFSSGFVCLEELDLNGYYNNGINFQCLKRLGKLRKLKLKNTGITDADLVHISDLVELIELDISHNEITDSGLKHLTNLPKLTKLDISYTGITDVGIENIVQGDPKLCLPLQGRK